MQPIDPDEMPSTINLPSRRRFARAALAGPGAALSTLLAVMGLSAVLPPGPAGIDGITFPLVLLPVVWAALFFHACLDRSLRRAALVALALCIGSATAVALHRAAPAAVAAP